MTIPQPSSDSVATCSKSFLSAKFAAKSAPFNFQLADLMEKRVKKNMQYNQDDIDSMNKNMQKVSVLHETKLL